MYTYDFIFIFVNDDEELQYMNNIAADSLD